VRLYTSEAIYKPRSWANGTVSGDLNSNLDSGSPDFKPGNLSTRPRCLDATVCNTLMKKRGAFRNIGQNPSTVWSALFFLVLKITLSRSFARFRCFFLVTFGPGCICCTKLSEWSVSRASAYRLEVLEHAQFPDKGPGTVSYPVQCTCLFRKKKTTLKGKSICSTLYVRTHHVPTILAAWTTLAEPKKNSGSDLVGTTLRPCRTS